VLATAASTAAVTDVEYFYIYYGGSHSTQPSCIRSILFTQSQIRDSIMLVTGPDKGRTGRMIGQEIVASRGGATSKKAVIKLNNTLGGIREIKVVPYEMVAKTFQQG
jgi:hypothetical protein